MFLPCGSSDMRVGADPYKSAVTFIVGDDARDIPKHLSR